MALAADRYISSEEYLRLERASETRSEYFAGRIYAMAGGGPEHAAIAANILALLWHQLRETECRPFGSDLRLRARETGLYTYPDVSVVCGDLEFDDLQRDTALNPRVIVEVLSPSTEGYDRGDKFAHYRSIPSLAEYLLVAREKPGIELYRRSGENWILIEITDLDGSVDLASIGCSLQVGEIYHRVQFAAGPGPGHP